MKTLTEILQRARDGAAGLRGAFGRSRATYLRRHTLRGRGEPTGGQHGPRPGTWWKQGRRVLTNWDAITLTPPPMFTRPQPKKQHLGVTSFHPGMMRLGRMMRGAFVGKRKRMIPNTSGALKRNHN